MFRARYIHPTLVTGPPETAAERFDVFCTLGWPLNEASGTTAAEINAGPSLTITGTPERINAPLAEDDVGGRCIGLSTSQFLTLADSTPVRSTEGAFILVWQPDYANRHYQLIVMTGEIGDTGEMYFEQLASGAMRFKRKNATGVIQTAVSIDNIVTVGVAATYVCSWGTRGLEIWKDGSLIANSVVATSWPTITTAPLKIGTWFNEILDRADGLIAYFGYRNTEPSPSQIGNAVLAQSVRLLVTTNVTINNMNENTSRLITGIRDHGHFSGALTLGLGSPAATKGTPSVNGEDVDYTAGSVASNQNESFGITIADTVGTLGTVVFNFVVINVPTSSGEFITSPEEHGWVNHPEATVTIAEVNTNRARFQEAVDEARDEAINSSTGRGVVELRQGRTYVTMAPSNGSNSAGPVGAINVWDNVEIRTEGFPELGPPPNFAPNSAMAIIKAHKWSLYGSGGGSNRVWQRCLLRADPANNCRIGWLVLDGNCLSTGTSYATRRSWLQNNVNYDGTGGNGGFPNLRLANGDDQEVFHVDSRNAITDGIAMRFNGGHPFISRSNFHHCRRNGITLTNQTSSLDLGYDRFIFFQCGFNWCGEQDGLIPGELPATGFDIEPLQPNIIRGLTLDGCVISDNQVATMEMGTVIGAYGGRGFSTETATMMRKGKIINGEFKRNVQEGLIFIHNNSGSGTTNGSPNTLAMDQMLIRNNIYEANGVSPDVGGVPLNSILYNPRGGGALVTYFTRIVNDNNRFIGGGGYVLRQGRLKPTGNDIKFYRGVNNFVYALQNNSNVTTILASNGEYPGGSTPP